MDHRDKELSWKWKMIQEQLITLSAFHKQSKGSNSFETFITEGFNGSFMNLSTFTQISYFLLGIINEEERNKLIKWPVVNIQGQCRFRKGLSLIVKDLMEKYPYFRLKRLPQSYLMDPNGNQKKILEFVLGLSNLAIYIALNDPSVLIMSVQNDINTQELETATNFIKRAQVLEEKLIEENQFPIHNFEDVRINITKKCVGLKHENSNLHTQLNKLKTQLADKMKLEKDSDIQIENLKQINREEFSELKKIYEKLQVYRKAGNDVITGMKAASEPVYLKADDFGLDDSETNLEDATVEAYNKLTQLFYSLKLKEAHLLEKEDYLQNLQNIKKALLEEKKVLESFIAKCSSSIYNFKVSITHEETKK